MNQKTSHDSETPAEGQQVITTCAFIWHDFSGVKKVFMPRRAETKKFLPNVYELPGGHIDFGEEIILGLKREINEEFEMNIEVGEPFFVFTYINEVKKSHSIEVIYLAQFMDNIEKIKIEPGDHSGYAWIAENEMEKVFTPGKGMDDPEMQAVKKGFEIINQKTQ